MSLRRVVVTGMGIVSPLGNDLRSFRKHLFAGKSGISRQQRPLPEWPETDGTPFEFLVGQVDRPELGDLPCQLNPKLLDDFSIFALSAADQAIAQAGRAHLEKKRARTAVVIGSGSGGDAARNLGTYRTYVLNRKPHPSTVVRAMSNAAACAVSVAHGITGPTFSINSGCASAAHAMAQCHGMIQTGMVDLALTGGSEMLPSYSLFRAWQSMGVLSKTRCRPFALDRDGISLGEGAGMVVLESLASARERGATIYAELTGCSMNADAADMVQPLAERMAEAMETALAAGGHRASDVDHINTHGTGTQLNDLAESQAIRSVLGERTTQVPVSACKSLLGHAIGAAGALEFIATILTLYHGCAPPTLLGDIDPACQLFLQANHPVEGEFKLALANSFAFGGLNATLALARMDLGGRP